jgi:predicted NBD/HSP70 family sugar kinase
MREEHVRGVTFTTRGALNSSALRAANERLVLNTIRQNPSLSRADIVRLTGLSPSSVTYIVGRLSKSRLISEADVEGPSQVGRRPTALRLRPESRMAVGVQILRPDSRVALADFNGKIVRTKIVRWHANSELFVDRVHAAVRTLVEPLTDGQLLGVGVGLPGTINRTSGKVIAAENFNWFGVEVGSLLSARISAPFYYENSVKLSALSEMWLSEQRGESLRNFVFVSARGGLGTGVIVNGQLLQGAHSAAVEFGHTMLYADGRPCSCGNIGCWEQYASDLALCRLYSELGEKEGKPAVDVEPAEVVRRARVREPIALRAIEEIAHYVALGLVNLIWALDPEAVIVGDWLAEAWDLIEDIVWKVVRNRVAGYYLGGLHIARAKTPEDSVLSGAIALVLSRFFTSFNNGTDSRPPHAVLMQGREAVVPVGE